MGVYECIILCIGSIEKNIVETLAFCAEHGYRPDEVEKVTTNLTVRN